MPTFNIYSIVGSETLTFKAQIVAPNFKKAIEIAAGDGLIAMRKGYAVVNIDELHYMRA